MDGYGYRVEQSQHKKHRRGRNPRFWILIAVVFIFLIYWYFPKNLSTTSSWQFNFAEEKKEDATLKALVEKQLDLENGHYAIFIQSLVDSDKSYYLNENEILPAASLYKLYLLAAAMEKVEKGELKMDTEITSNTDRLESELGFVDFGYEEVEGDITYTLEDILHRIATISDNYASIMLVDKIGWDAVQNQARLLGSNSTTIKDPISTTAGDTGNYFKKLYHGEVVSRQASDKIIQLLSESKLNSRIPKLLPEGLKIAHKTGELSRIRHDSGIVFLEGKPYVIVLMTTDIKGEDTATETQANISKAVYDYFLSDKSRESGVK